MQTLQVWVDFEGRISQYGVEMCRILLAEFEKVQMSNQSCRVSLKRSVADLKQQPVIYIWKPGLKLASEENKSLPYCR